MLSIFVLVLFQLVFGRIEEDVTPPMLQECYDNNVVKSDNQLQSQTNCLNQYLNHLFPDNITYGIDQSALDWIDSLGRQVHTRMKRQAARGGQRRLPVRKEIRTLSEAQRANYFRAVNALKRDTTVRPNKYDAFAVLHQGDAIPSAHDGYNFVSWHRYYLVLFEEALQTKSRSVTIPYWDSTLCFNMQKPEDTIVFSPIFFGNGKGIVVKGPFALWVTPSQNTLLRRDIPGPQSSLIDPDKLKNVFTKRYHREILNPTAANDNDNLESHHDAVHRWVGGADGHMGGLLTSPQDPIFWSHHAFIDYLWEQFRERQTKLGIDSEKDYPKTDDPFHQPNRVMDNLKPPKTNIEGYSNIFTKTIYRYADAPTCKNKCGGGYQGYLYCDRKRNVCVSRSRQDFIRNTNYYSRVKTPYLSTQLTSGNMKNELSFEIDTSRTRSSPTPAISRRFRASIVDPRTRNRQRRSPHLLIDGSTLKMNLEIQLGGNFENRNHMNYIPNHFSSIHVAAAPVQIINEQKSKGIGHELSTFQNQITESGTYNITLQTDGFSYNGRHLNNITIDKRTVSSNTFAYIGFEDPVVSGETRSYVHVYDSFGNVCRTMCLEAKNNGPTYRDCSGAIKVNEDFPLMYIDSYYKDSGSEMTPFLKFVCSN